MTAVSTMIVHSLIMTGEKSIGDTLESDEQAYYLSRLQSMIASWGLERAFLYQLSQTSFALTANTVSYTIGPGATFNMTRPNKLVDPCFIRDADNFDSPLQIIDMVAYGRIVDKAATGSYPSLIAYDSAYSATSTASVYFWPGPQAGLSTYINTLQPLQSLSTVSQNLQLPDGYQRAIETNFAIETAPGFVTLDKEIINIARQSKAAVKSSNLTAPISRLDYGVVPIGGRSNILTGP